MKFRTVVVIVVFLGLTISAVADSPAMPRPMVFVSPAGHHYFRLIPAPDFDSAKAVGFLYRVESNSDELVYETKGWYSFSVLVSNDGKNLVRTGHWPNKWDPPETTPALIFYCEGKEIRVVNVADIIEDVGVLPRSISHYSWGGSLEWVNRGWDGQVQVQTVEGKTIIFDIETGDIDR